METIEYKDVIDKANWPRGEWDSEPDKKQWLDPISGLPCMIKRNRMGVWCGYVGLSEGHKYHGEEYHDIDVDVHGGLTYSDFCQDESDPAHSICHVAPGGPVWWLGFDCGHSSDYAPNEFQPSAFEGLFGAYHGLDGGRYRNQAYAEAEVLRLAGQLT